MLRLASPTLPNTHAWLDRTISMLTEVTSHALNFRTLVRRRSSPVLLGKSFPAHVRLLPLYMLNGQPLLALILPSGWPTTHAPLLWVKLDFTPSPRSIASRSKSLFIYKIRGGRRCQDQGQHTCLSGCKSRRKTDYTISSAGVYFDNFFLHLVGWSRRRNYCTLDRNRRCKHVCFGQREKTVALHARACKPFHALARIHTHLHVLARICTHLHAPKIAICTQ